jgi:hypothetical protein
LDRPDVGSASWLDRSLAFAVMRTCGLPVIEQ